MASSANGAKIPFRVSPMLATLVPKPFHNPNWVYEEKYDGIRILAYKEGRQTSLFTRNNINRTKAFPNIAAAISRLKPATLLLDGEVVVFDEKRVSRFQLLQERAGQAKYTLFDCLFVNGKDLRAAPLVERRSRYWLKAKVHQEDEFIIGGYTPPAGARKYFGALLLGAYNRGVLRYVGKVGTGFDEQKLGLLFHKFQALKRKEFAFVPAPNIKNAVFLSPKLVAQISFAEWTRDGKLRQPVFLGLREDRDPKDVVIQRA